ncbi:MAG: hypothetical protein A3F84_24590 [Candidatus Handelsmanbacteria bacterium RIFCSPLOWO2_12_FULL_64_10]|uniref:Uncharacterized protein n=1 Tax=Handelsmanbacteria sp. (strain RIFCSPLOWO2_12_FULL_64_10) TaxID=1817868 RepID=A0A1F6C2T5_HANXR|nr:MAG: hypothetical protein A3F84_24590 [Candidatus Handelsmanbacteria bacterium RIFCSPLOWO2_12_FULL_64_10]
MRHRNARRPVGKCKGCGLNFRTFCGKFENPKEMWVTGRCKGFMNEALLQEYLREAETPHLVTSKMVRQEVARLRATEPHYQGKERPEHRYV